METALTEDAVLDAILAGARTKAQIAERLSIPLHPVFGSPALNLMLNRLHCADLLAMQVVDADWHHLPTRKALSSTPE